MKTHPSPSVDVRLASAALNQPQVDARREERRVREVLALVADPEIPVLTIADLGILREVRVDGTQVHVTVTPTYSGCPAMDEIRADIVAALQAAGWHDVTVDTTLAPAWTTDWMSEEGRRKLVAYGIAAPGPRAKGPVPITLGSRRTSVACPQCASTETEELTRFSSTSCKSMRRCLTCREPFEQFKAH